MSIYDVGRDFHQFRILLLLNCVCDMWPFYVAFIALYYIEIISDSVYFVVQCSVKLM